LAARTARSFTIRRDSSLSRLRKSGRNAPLLPTRHAHRLRSYPAERSEKPCPRSWTLDARWIQVLAAEVSHQFIATREDQMRLKADDMVSEDRLSEFTTVAVFRIRQRNLRRGHMDTHRSRTSACPPGRDDMRNRRDFTASGRPDERRPTDGTPRDHLLLASVAPPIQTVSIARKSRFCPQDSAGWIRIA